MSPISVPVHEDNRFAPSSKSATAYKRFNLPETVTPGILHLPSSDGAQAKKALETLLAQDRESHHCFFNPAGFHNHLSHHLLAAYDLGASAELLEAIYENEKANLLPIDVVLDSATKQKNGQFDVKKDDVTITSSNWKRYLGQNNHYAAYVAFFTKEIQAVGVKGALERYIFSQDAKQNDALMQWRLTSGVFHPLIQIGYGLEFNSDAMVAQALAQTAMHSVRVPEVLLARPPPSSQSTPTPLLEILRKVYDSDVLKPVMPYDPDVGITQRYKDLYTNGRPEEIQHLSSLWWSKHKSQSGVSSKEIDAKIEELIWAATLILGAVSKRDRKPRLDFFLMHILNMTVFLPAYARVLSTEQMTIVLECILPSIIATLIMRGRPRIDVDFVMSYTKNPLPRALRRDDGAGASGDDKAGTTPSKDAIQPGASNPWLRILQDVVHAPDPHTMKAIRALYHGAQAYAYNAAPGHVVGAYEYADPTTSPSQSPILAAKGGDGETKRKEETLNGSGKLDGTVFVRVAGEVMDVLGWVTYGEDAGDWDRSGLGWDDAWKDGK